MSDSTHPSYGCVPKDETVPYHRQAKFRQYALLSKYDVQPVYTHGKLPTKSSSIWMELTRTALKYNGSKLIEIWNHIRFYLYVHHLSSLSMLHFQLMLAQAYAFRYANTQYDNLRIYVPTGALLTLLIDSMKHISCLNLYISVATKDPSMIGNP